MKNYLSFLFAGIFFLSSCSSIQVTSDYDKTVDFTKFKTYEYYGWAENSDKILTPFDKERIEKAFADEFSKRGLTYVEEGGDLVVALYIVTEKKTETTANTTSMGYGGFGGYYGYGPGWGWGGGYGGMGHTTTTFSTYDYTVGTLVVDVFDKAGEKLIWESVGTKTVDENPQTRDDSVPKAVAAIMKEYPVPPIEEGKK
ncbi:MAG: DUF4136 domain-containing protein [Bacteroidales bacterium]|nr:DUF4136 domain-containing protein [Bacteroidales bacterium]MCF6341275.1 DUF4136 domain-containing protein [Bacteroidales bacterium]